MNISLENQSEIVTLMPGLFQFEENGNWTQCVVGFNKTDLLIFNDFKPDNINKDGSLIYHVKMSYPLKEIHVFMNEILKSYDLSYANRINVMTKNDKNSFMIYYFKHDKKMVRIFLKALKRRGYAVKKNKVEIQSTLDK